MPQHWRRQHRLVRGLLLCLRLGWCRAISGAKEWPVENLIEMLAKASGIYARYGAQEFARFGSTEQRHLNHIIISGIDHWSPGAEVPRRYQRSGPLWPPKHILRCLAKNAARPISALIIPSMTTLHPKRRTSSIPKSATRFQCCPDKSLMPIHIGIRSFRDRFASRNFGAKPLLQHFLTCLSQADPQEAGLSQV